MSFHHSYVIPSFESHSINHMSCWQYTIILMSFYSFQDQSSMEWQGMTFWWNDRNVVRMMVLVIQSAFPSFLSFQKSWPSLISFLSFWPHSVIQVSFQNSVSIGMMLEWQMILGWSWILSLSEAFQNGTAELKAIGAKLMGNFRDQSHAPCWLFLLQVESHPLWGEQSLPKSSVFLHC